MGQFWRLGKLLSYTPQPGSNNSLLAENSGTECLWLAVFHFSKPRTGYSLCSLGCLKSPGLLCSGAGVMHGLKYIHGGKARRNPEHGFRTA